MTYPDRPATDEPDPDAGEQLALLTGVADRTPPGPWRAVCGAVGPYAIPEYGPTGRRKLVILTCTRPKGHDPRFHQAADARSVVLASWSPNGLPILPPTLRAGD